MKKNTATYIVFIKIFGELLFLYGFLGWSYGVLVQITHPEWMPYSLSHLTPWVRVDTFTMLSFVVSAIGFFVWRLTKES